MGLMFNKIIPMEMLAQMPLPFVHRLRDIRLKQLQEANRSQNMNGLPVTQVPQGAPINYAIQQAAIDDLVDELS